MRTLSLLVLGGMIAGAGSALAAEDHNSTRSNEGQIPDAPVQVAPANHNTTWSNKTARAVATDDSDSAMMSETETPRDAASGLPTGKRQHQP
jgi:hypothetical protein